MAELAESDWLAGFADGEGCFLILRSRSNKCKKQPSSFRFTFRIQQRDDDAAIVIELQKVFGGIVTFKYLPSQKDTGTNPTVSWVVAARADILGLIDYFDAHPLRSKKRRDYILWREAAMVYYHNATKGGNQGGNPEWLVQAIEEYRKKMKELRKYQGTLGSTEIIAPKGDEQLWLLEI